MKVVTDSIVKSHYQVALPLNRSQQNMWKNQKIVEQRTQNLKSRVKKDPLFQQQYTDLMNEIISKAFAEVPLEELTHSDGRSGFTPHFDVYHPQKGKICVVFDCEAWYIESFERDDGTSNGIDSHYYGKLYGLHLETGVAYGVSGDLALMTLTFYNLNRNGTTAKAGEHGSWAILSTPENLLSLSLTGHKGVRFHSILQPTNFMCSDVVLTVSKLLFLNFKNHI